MITTTNLNHLRKEIELLKKNKKPVIVQAQGDDFNRKVFENPNVDLVIGLELHNRKDYMKQRDSGLNEVLCKLAHKNNIKIGLDIKKIKKLGKKDKAIVLSRIKQNISLAKRTKAKIIVLDSKKYSNQELSSFMISLGASTIQAKEASNKI